MRITPDPPPMGVPLTDDDVRMPYPPPGDPRRHDAVAETAGRATLLASTTYRLLASALRTEAKIDLDPLDVIRDMATGRWRWRRLRGTPGVLELDQSQAEPVPVPEHMAFRAIAEELERITGVAVSHETLRRWWSAVWPDDPPPNQALYADRARRPARPVSVIDAEPGGIPPATFLPPPDVAA